MTIQILPFKDIDKKCETASEGDNEHKNAQSSHGTWQKRKGKNIFDRSMCILKWNFQQIWRHSDQRKKKRVSNKKQILSKYTSSGKKSFLFLIYRERFSNHSLPFMSCSLVEEAIFKCPQQGHGSSYDQAIFMVLW